MKLAKPSVIARLQTLLKNSKIYMALHQQNTANLPKLYESRTAFSHLDMFFSFLGIELFAQAPYNRCQRRKKNSDATLR